MCASKRILSCTEGVEGGGDTVKVAVHWHETSFLSGRGNITPAFSSKEITGPVSRTPRPNV